MKKPLFAYILLFCFLSQKNTTAQVIQRDLLIKTFSVEQVKQNLVPQSKWKPFPTEPAVWAKQVPDSVRKSIIKLAEE